ncbi:MAG: glutathionylspermidine synthase family protein [Spirochaetes bacterium]|nr:glutathionylspermidine synthase family protein [Spirochaetota bacterium]
MTRHTAITRSGWEKKVEDVGFVFHTDEEENLPYWDESAYYSFTPGEIDSIEAATNDLHEKCLTLTGHVVDDYVKNGYRNSFLKKLSIPEAFAPWIAESWENDFPKTMYGRFDLVVTPEGSIKMLEYNADTPTSLLEASVVQWYWLKDVYPMKDQFNNIHESLLDAWKFVANDIGSDTLYCACVKEHVEDLMTATYMADVAHQAGITTRVFYVDEIGLADDGRFTMNDEPMRWCYKLYPWEWMVNEEFGRNLTTAGTNWIEPPWKMILSNKGMLPLLSKIFGDTGAILPAHFSDEEFDRSGRWVEKPYFGREGSNITILESGRVVDQAEGPYAGSSIMQRYTEIPGFNGNYPVIGSWIIGDTACGMGIRETNGRITGNMSRFVPHIIE